MQLRYSYGFFMRNFSNGRFGVPIEFEELLV